MHNYNVTGELKQRSPEEIADAEMIGGNIRRFRERAGMSLQDLADATGKSKNGIHKIEKGRTNIQGDTLRIIAKALKVDIVNLVLDSSGPLSEQLQNFVSSTPDLLPDELLKLRATEKLFAPKKLTRRDFSELLFMIRDDPASNPTR